MRQKLTPALEAIVPGPKKLITGAGSHVVHDELSRHGVAGTVNAAVCPVTVTRTLEITEGNNTCTNTTTDVVTDPFGFGGGPRSATSDGCGANYVLATAVAAPVPSPGGSSVDPSGSASIATRKDVAVSSGSYRTPWTGTEQIVIPSGTAATVETRINGSAA